MLNILKIYFDIYFIFFFIQIFKVNILVVSPKKTFCWGLHVPHNFFLLCKFPYKNNFTLFLGEGVVQ